MTLYRFLDMTPKAQETKESKRLSGLHQTLKVLCFKGYHQVKLKNNLQNGRKYLQIIYLIGDLYAEYIKNSYNSTIKRQIAQLLSGERF